MKKWFFLLSISVFILFTATNCSTDKSPLVSQSHPEDWNLKTGENFHGNKVMAAGHNSCKSCHGAEFEGGASGVSCNTCHASYPHPAEWPLFNNPKNHAQFIQNSNGDSSKCRTCHGADLQGGRSGVSCNSCHPEHEGDD
jgi:hypothetical protein